MFFDKKEEKVMDKKRLTERLGATIAISQKTQNKNFVLCLKPEFIEQDKVLVVVRVKKEKFEQYDLENRDFFLEKMRRYFEEKYFQCEVENGGSEGTLWIQLRVDETLVDFLDKLEWDELIDSFYFEFRELSFCAEGYQ